MREPIKITVRTKGKFKPLRFASVMLLQVGIISVGIYADSQAMQWAGFVFFVAGAVSFAHQEVKREEGLTIKEARARLNEIEAEEA